MILVVMTGCSNKVEEEKYTYLSYKSELQKQEEFDDEEEADFNSYFDVKRENEEVVTYRLVIDKPKMNMYNVKALLIHDYGTSDVFPSVGIFDDAITLLTDSEDRIVLEGEMEKGQDDEDMVFRLYLEYTLEDGTENKVYYKLNRG